MVRSRRALAFSAVALFAVVRREEVKLPPSAAVLSANDNGI